VCHCIFEEVSVNCRRNTFWSVAVGWTEGSHVMLTLLCVVLRSLWKQAGTLLLSVIGIRIQNQRRPDLGSSSCVTEGHTLRNANTAVQCCLCFLWNWRCNLHSILRSQSTMTWAALVLGILLSLACHSLYEFWVMCVSAWCSE